MALAAMLVAGDAGTGRAQTNPGEAGPMATKGWYGTLDPLPPVVGPSPYLPDGRTLDGDTGRPIPCKCRAFDRDWRVADKICLSGPKGLVIAHCQRVENITSWVFTDEPCTTQ